MTATTSSYFASSAHGGDTWREAAKQILDDLNAVKTHDDEYTLGLVYVTDHLAKDIVAIINLFRSVLGIRQWAGSVGVGICGAHKLYVDEIGISVMMTTMDVDRFRVIKNIENHTQWIDDQSPMLLLAHAHPPKDAGDLEKDLNTIETATNGFITGGLSLCRPDKAPKITSNHDTINMHGGVDLVAFAADVPVMSMMSQGCTPVGDMHTVTRVEGVTIKTLNNQSPQDVFETDLRNFAKDKIGKDPDDISVETVDDIPDEYKHVFTGEILAGFPLRESDTNEMVVRPIMGINDNGTMMVQHLPNLNDRIVFMHRDDESVAADLRAELEKLKIRIENEYGVIKIDTIKGGVYISCAARALTEEGKPNRTEIDTIRDVLGDFPLTGFFSGGEIKGTRIYALTGMLVLFL